MDFIICKPSECGLHWGDVSYDDLGACPGYLRGYNLEMRKGDLVDYASMFCTYLDCDYSNPEVCSTVDLCAGNGWTPTGRAVFRGYFRESYSIEDRDFYVEPVDLDTVFQTDSDKER